MSATSFDPQQIFSPQVSHGGIVAKVLNSPHKYIQAPGALHNLGLYLKLLNSRHTATVITSGGENRFGQVISDSLSKSSISDTRIIFQGESTLAEIERITGELENSNDPIDAIVAIGGGKCIDTGRAVAYRMSLPSIICPTTASTDAPCSALSVIYNESGEFIEADFYPLNPTLVVVDTKIAAQAPYRYIVSGLGDAMATWYEARTCFENPDSFSLIGTRPTLVGLAIAELCAKTLYENALDAIAAVKNNQVNDAVEKIVEANTLMSGIGFESCGVAAAHAIGQGFNSFPEIDKKYLHGEMVAFGLIAHLLLEDRYDEAEKAATFFAKVGLPVHLGQLSFENPTIEERKKHAQAALAIPIIQNEPFEVTERMVIDIVDHADKFGRMISKDIGDEPYHSIHSD
ncbi:MAG: glycerol dehydrogenase [Thermodesulfobacteriota bacterium]